MSEEKAKPFGQHTCHICGNTEFTWAKYKTPSYSLLVPEHAGFMDYLVGGKTPRIRICIICGNVQMFVETPE